MDRPAAEGVALGEGAALDSGVLDFEALSAAALAFSSAFLALRFISSNLGMARDTSSLVAPKSVSKVVMLGKWFSAAVLCLKRSGHSSPVFQVTRGADMGAKGGPDPPKALQCKQAHFLSTQNPDLR